MIVFCRGWEPLQEEQEVGLERSPPWDGERLGETDGKLEDIYAATPRNEKRELWPMTESRWLRCVRRRWASAGGNSRGGKVLLRC